MANPTFNGTELISTAARCLPGCPRARVSLNSLPGVDGAYASLLGRGVRRLAAVGFLEATDGGDSGSGPAAANQALQSALRARQELADGATIASYVGTDGHEYTHCILLSYEPAGQVQHATDGSTHIARLPVRVTLVQLDPTE